VANNPKRVLQQAAARASEKHSAEHLLYAANRLAIRDAPATADLWRSVTKRYDIPTTEDHAILRRIGIAAAQDYEPRAAGLLEQVPDQAADERVIEWRARTAMREGRWGDVLRIIAAMPSALSASERWRYWEATALKETGQTEVAEALMAVLATERSYYGFLAADVSGLPYAFDHAELDVSDERLAALANDPQLVRARELFAVDQPARARAEWQRALRGRAAVDKAAAAELAHRWQWHSEAITLLGELQSWDDLDIRYPLAYQDWIAEHAGRASVRSAWVYGITRSESLFTRDIRSSAGAWGLMQLMPATGKRVAREAGITWQGIDTLKDAELNIALGTRYLAYLQDRFSHPALATAAYNAGPHRVQRWLPDTTPMRADVWIETIAYDETRAYVQRVLSADIIFQWRMGEPVQRLADILTPVAPKQSVAQTVTPL
ncbi:MAG: transglycosylase SLT domain-containing protein, partial [Pseudomonadota bacterium]